MSATGSTTTEALAIDLASVDEVLGTARSVRRKLDFERPIPKNVLYDCINLATQAPIGLGGENWRFVVVDEPEQKLGVATIYRSVLEDLQRQRGLELKPTQRALADRLHDMPAMVLVSVPAQGQAMTVQLCEGGSLSLPANGPAPGQGSSAPCCAKGCHSGPSRKRLDRAQ